MDDRLTTLSKTLAYVLRHRPASIGIELDSAGWVDVSLLLTAMADAGHQITGEDLQSIVMLSDKRRYELRSGRIRAAQGHSLDVDLGLEPVVPPDVLYHGTIASVLPQIRSEGLRSGQRMHVHLSSDRDTARAIGGRRGPAVILEVDARSMHDGGHTFYRAANGVWLVEAVPAVFLLH